MFTSSRIKRKMQFDSPKMSEKSQVKQLVFDDDQGEMDSPVKMAQPRKLFIDNIDENSCGSAFSEHGSEMDDMSQSSDLDDSFSFVSKQTIEQDLPKKYLESPFSRFRLNQQESSQNDKLIGDMSRIHTLPILSKSRHNDLASIEPKTLVDLLNGKYEHKIGEYIILDARYPYEFNGGHVSSAQSAFLKDQDNYPNLFYPEIYLLEGGYKRFFEESIQLCEPRSYMPMSDSHHKQDMNFLLYQVKSQISLNKTFLFLHARTSGIPYII
ncbi:hypothetical protein BpHYR1_030145 [Brachionus plicatilis]|uniref:protein-tyrosine-phosphatase n=1 Tax=Brachionus plicatilis TaxID=10195 RepID=A0A3M7RCP2_BRAPC|nr:hypothetical protein BpHYR1_030145 [Brachionus plicatilis]